MENEVDKARGMLGKDENFIKIVFWKIERKRSLWRHRLRRKDNIKINRKKNESVGVGYVQDWEQWRTLVYTIMNLRVSLKEGNFLISWVTNKDPVTRSCSENKVVKKIFISQWIKESQDSSVSVVTGWTARVRFPAAQDFSFLHNVQTDSLTHPAFYPTGTRRLFPRG
jgi:hypothetical protein